MSFMNPCILNRCCGALLCAAWGCFVTLLLIIAAISIALSLGGCTVGPEPLMPTH